MQVVSCEQLKSNTKHSRNYLLLMTNHWHSLNVTWPPEFDRAMSDDFVLIARRIQLFNTHCTRSLALEMSLSLRLLPWTGSLN